MALMTAKMIYVFDPMFSKAGGVIITTSQLKIQLLEVDRALAGARIRRGVISAGYSQVIPSQPTAKNELKTNKKTMPTIWHALASLEPTPARIAMEAHCPAAPKSISFRRPTRSTNQIAGREARKYSVPFRAAIRRGICPVMPSPE